MSMQAKLDQFLLAIGMHSFHVHVSTSTVGRPLPVSELHLAEDVD